MRRSCNGGAGTPQAAAAPARLLQLLRRDGDAAPRRCSRARRCVRRRRERAARGGRSLQRALPPAPRPSPAGSLPRPRACGLPPAPRPAASPGRPLRSLLLRRPAPLPAPLPPATGGWPPAQQHSLAPGARSPADGPPQDAGRGAEVVGAPGGVGVVPLPQEALVLHLLAHQATGDDNLLAAGHHLPARGRVSTLGTLRGACPASLRRSGAAGRRPGASDGTHDVVAAEDLLGDDRGQAAEHVPAGIDNHRLRARG
jgi:hypothetical protein